MKNILCLFAFFFALLGTLPAEDIFCDNIPAAYDNRGCFQTMSFSAKTFDLREKEWSKTEEKLFPCEYLENIRWVNK